MPMNLYFQVKYNPTSSSSNHHRIKCTTESISTINNSTNKNSSIA